jgi:PPOX class probable F420-dependent enzyme
MLTPEQITFLERQRVARLATVDARGRPHVLPVCYAFTGGALYTPVDEKPKRSGELQRVKNILTEPHVCLVVDHYEEEWSRLAWLQVRGIASLVADDAERQRALVALRARYPQYVAMDLEVRPLIRITPERVVGWSARMLTG